MSFRSFCGREIPNHLLLHGHIIYVDKPLFAGVAAVQTLSRPNRAYKPYKQDIFILDFYNSAGKIMAEIFNCR